MKNRNVQKIEAITPGTLVVGVDIAKETQWARFVDYRGLELREVLKFKNYKNGFAFILVYFFHPGNGAYASEPIQNTNCLTQKVLQIILIIT